MTNNYIFKKEDNEEKKEYLILLENIIKKNLDPFKKAEDTMVLLNDLYKITHLINNTCLHYDWQDYIYKKYILKKFIY